MSDLGRGIGGTTEEERLPWLEPVEEEGADQGVSAGRLISGLLVALAALGLVVGGVYWLKQRVAGPAGGAGDATTIAAQPGPYKVKPAEPGGLNVKGQGDSSYAASEGADPNARIDLSAVPEAPIAKPKGAAVAAAPAPAAVAPAKPVEVAKAAPAPAPAKPAPVKSVPVVAKAEAPKVEPKPKAEAKPKAEPKPAPAKPAPAKTETASASAPGGSGGSIQLGAFSSEAKANEAWKSLSGRFAYLGALNKSVMSVTSNGKTVYRLRASGGGASSVCSKLKVAGETCLVVG